MSGPFDEGLARHGGAASPQGAHFDAALAKKRPLTAFTLLLGGDVFEQVGGGAPKAALPLAKDYVRQRVTVHAHGASREHVRKVRTDIVRLIGGNPELVRRLEVARPLDVVLIPAGKSMKPYGFPDGASLTTLGLFWDHPDWATARIALRQEEIDRVPQLTVHEMAHAIHFLAFTEEERQIIYRMLLRSFGSHSAVDEVFAIYSERELIPEFTDKDKQGPHVYGLARRRWSEDHVFTRFIRYLYFPHKPLAGPKIAPPTSLSG